MNQLQEVQSINTLPGFKIEAEIDKQIMTAKAFPRNVDVCLQNIINFIEGDQEIADSCVYALEKKNKYGGKEFIEGPSVRLAEIFIAEWGNINANTKLLSNDGQRVIASGRCWDLEKNVSSEMQVSKSIVKSDKTTYSATQQEVTISAAASIALRNAIFMVIPKVLIEKVYKIAKDVSVNGSKNKSFDLEERRKKVFQGINRLGIKAETVLAYFNKTSIDQLDKEDIQHILAIGTSVKDGLIHSHEAFQSNATKAVQLASIIDDQEIGAE